jgi:GT2 family glycosyltransferase
MNNRISISLISHGQIALAKHVLDDLHAYCADDIAEVLLTINMAETVSLSLEHFAFPIRVLRNASPKGFGANHNAAFRLVKGDFFCVLNPDIRLTDNPFPALVELAERERVGVVAPRICNGAGEREDSARCFPTLRELLGKFFGGKSAAVPDTAGVCAPDWVAGMFMLFPTSVFREMNGFDERYFLYYEDVDLCARLALAGYKRLVCPDVRVVHEARRSSHRDVRYAWMHVQSILRFFSSDVYRRVRRLRQD